MTDKTDLRGLAERDAGWPMERRAHETQRAGQAAWNAAAAILGRPTMDRLFSDVDPFHHDERLDTFLGALGRYGARARTAEERLARVRSMLGDPCWCADCDVLTWTQGMPRRTLRHLLPAEALALLEEP